jgi:hypothetical protein
MSSKLKAGIIGFGLAVALVGTAIFAIDARAADKGGPRHQDIVAPSAEAWTGPSIAIGAGWNVGMASFGGPVGAAADGASVTGTVAYDKQFGNLVGGVFLGYSRFTGDLESIGVNADVFGGARLGVLTSSSNLLYAHLGYGRLDTDGGNISGWRLGVGDEMKLSGPFSLDWRYSYGIHDTDNMFGPGVETRSHTLGLNLVYRFNQ